MPFIRPTVCFIIGFELKKAILQLMNEVNTSQILPENMQLASITSILKNKGS